ncbi:T9SS type A sorting domain-containing protein [Paracrocinitomix mangrovi]|uniref:M43 family zinc metalloprotease n=1 Tax=Paracrocinitomix mangrovi TaxID=2862509 RepID=UPI001C8E1DBE|nr:M43 family zinc metalloprotease [Paracrocinitomix mangrovi]UKN00170.1 T9SS type A sorting domain-containing protein [Paracrocinitomix mangrovi]
MKKILLSIFALSSIISFGQERVCGFDEHNEMLHQQYPGSKQSVDEQIQRFREGGHNHAGERSTIGIIPVVVHVIHDGGSSNISYAQIQSAIDQINDDYQKLNADTSNIRNTAQAPFYPESGNMQLEFKLARIDPNGNCTNGVERRYSPASAYNAGDDVKYYSSGGLNAWPRDKYLNIWVVETIESSGGGITLGYAQFPYFGNANTYGIVIRNDAMGTMGTALSGDRTLTHELGHCFGLFHTFQDGCSNQDCGANGDYCCDTPPVLEAQWSCGSTQNTCSGIPTNDAYGFDAYDQFENYMSYSPCQYMFSLDQVDIVQGNFSNIGFLQDLISPSNATATGVNQPDVLCAAEFSSTISTICAGSTVTYSDMSYFNVSGVNWTFNGGTPSTSTDSSVTVTYNTPGVYSVTLEATDGSTTVSTTETQYVLVLDNPGVTLPYSEGFESTSSIPDNATWFIENEDGGQAWAHQTGGVGSSGDKSVKLSNFAVTNGSKDNLISGTIDLSSVDSTDAIVFNFKYAYRKRSATNDEWLRFYVSDDCGETWTLRKNIHGNSLSDQTMTSPYTPAVEDWVQVDVTNINSAFFVSNFRFKFEFENDGGNNIYIDDINLYPASMTGLDESIADNLSVYPNPATDMLNISMDVYDAGIYRITLTNMLGQEVAVIHDGELMAGQGKLNYDISNFNAGVYFLNIAANGKVRTTKVIKQ